MSLPSYVVRLLGRDNELALARHALAESRCVTIVGPGGIGKSHLAVEAARAASADLGLTAQFVAVDSASGRDALPAVIANQLGIHAAPDQSVSGAVISHLRDAALLLMLDGLDAASDFEYWLFDLAYSCPDVRLLVTSRQRLNLPHEIVIELGALAHDAAGIAADVAADAAGLTPAEAMFLQAVRSVAPSYQPDAQTRRDIRDLCQLVEGMPLAIELAAYWVPKVPVRFIVNQLAHSLEWLTDARHLTHSAPRSLQAVFDHFWARLNAEERRAMTRLAVFEGGFDLAAARSLADIPDSLIAGLTDGYFLKPLPFRRYTLHALMRRYLLARLPETETDLAAFERRFSQVFLRRAREYVWLNTTTRFAKLARELADDFPNMRSALALSVRNRDAALALGLVAALGELWRLTGHAFDMRGLCQKAMALDMSGVDAMTRAQALTAYGLMLESGGDYEAAFRACAEAVELAAASELDGPLSAAAEALAQVEMRRGHYAASLEAASLALRSAERGGDARDRARALGRMGNSLFHADRLDEAQSRLEEALAFADICDQPALRIAVLNDRAVLNMRRAAFRSAIDDLRQMLDLSGQMGIKYNRAGALSNLGYAHSELGNHAEAGRYLREAIAEAERIGMRALAAYANTVLGRVQRVLDGDGMPYFMAALKIAVEIQSQRRLLAVFLLLSEACAERGEDEAALRLLGVALARSTLSVEERAFGDGVLARVRARVGPARVGALFDAMRGVAPEALARVLLDGKDLKQVAALTPVPAQR